MADNWDDSDDEWDVGSDDDELDKRLGLKKEAAEPPPEFDEEEDLTIKDKAAQAEKSHADLKKKGNALAAKKKAEQERKEELEIARKAMELEAEMEEKLTIDERKALERRRVEEADMALTDDLFGGGVGPKPAAAVAASDVVVMKDLKDHLKHARRVSECMKKHGKVAFAAAFLKECIQQSKDVLDDDAISELIKTCNVIKNEKVAAAKRKVKGQAQKSSKRDKAAEAKAKKLQQELYGDNDQYDDYDVYGEQYEDDFF